MQKLLKDGTVERTDDGDYQLIVGKEAVRNPDGTKTVKNKYGGSVVNKKLSDVDNMIDGKISIAENTLNTANVAIR